MTEQDTSDLTVRIEPPDPDIEVTQVIELEQRQETRTAPMPSREEKTVVEAASQTTTFFRTHFFTLKKRKDLNSVMDRLHEKHVHGEIHFSDAEDKLEPLADTYGVENEFAEGGQGILYHGFDRKLQRLVAIKSLRREMVGDEAQRGLFLNEARVTAQLDHPAIVPVYTLNSDSENGLHLAMKMIRGETLKSYLDQVATHYRLDGVKSYDENNALRFRLDTFLKVCDALEYAHSRNVMHRDLKPSNIMIGEYHETYIMDWGIARRIREPEGEENEKQPLCGTPQYLAPEAIRGEACDQRADIFAMGAILFEMVLLKPAFTGESVPALMANIRKGNMEPLEHRFHAPVDSDLKAIIRKATANDPEQRYGTIGALAADLRHYLAGLEVSACPDNLLMKAVRWCYLHRRLTVTVMLVALLVGAGALAFAMYREYRFSEELRLRDYALGTAYSYGSGAAYRLDKQFSKLELMTSLLAADVQYLLRYDPGNGGQAAAWPTYSVAELREKPSPGMIDSAFHRGKIDPEAVVYNLTPDTDRATLESRLRTLSRIVPRLLLTILESPFDAWVTEENRAALTQTAFAEGTPMIRVLFGFPDGLYMAYPASGAFPLKYDPRRRSWYPPSDTWKTEAAVWSRPYVDSIPSIGLVISCSVPMRMPEPGKIGVCAVDISLAELIDELRSAGNSGDYLMEKAIVDDTGRIIVSTTQSFADANLRSFKSGDDKVEFAKLDNPALWVAMKTREFGTFIQEDADDREVVYLFYHIRSVDWYYLEKLDMERLSETLRPPKGDPET